MKKRRIKKKVIFIFFIFILLIIGGFIGINTYKLKNSYPYKLKEMGYKEEEIKTILTLNDDEIDNILKKEKNIVIPKLIKQKYFIFENLDRYLAYYKNNERDKKDHIIAIVNTNRDYQSYTNTKPADLTKQYGILVNRYNYLGKDYIPDDLQPVSIKYAYGTQQLRQAALEQFIKMFNAAQKENIKIVIGGAYRSYDYQDKMWNRYSNENGADWADIFAARPGYSEHQTGLAIDLIGATSAKDFEKTEVFKWMEKHSYEYGFILRYPKGLEDITSFSYEPWHYRYVGIDIAKKIHDENITLDEYYAYYLNDEKR